MGEKQRFGGIAPALVGHCCGLCPEHSRVFLYHSYHKLTSSLRFIQRFLRARVGLGNFTEVQSFIPSLNLSRRE